MRKQKSRSEQILRGVRSQAERLMNRLARRSICAAAWLLLSGCLAFAQDEAIRTVDLPNPMSAHTWFIIAAIGAFLLWCISYALQLQKEVLTKKKSRDS